MTDGKNKTKSTAKAWSSDELVMALALYLRTPYERIQKTNPDIADVAAAMGRSANSLTLKLWNFGSLDKKVTKAGLGHVSAKDLDVWNRYVGADFRMPLGRLLDDAESASRREGVPPDLILGRMPDPTLPTESPALRKERLHQDYFRHAVIERYCGVCLVTGLRSQTLIEVAHIVSWRTDPSLRLVPANGLTLNPLIHRAYDANLIGISPDMIVSVSPVLLERVPADTDLRRLLENIDGRPLRRPVESRAEPDRDCLARHYRDYLDGSIPASAFL